MTDSNPFFRFIWRVNALVILVTALGAALVLAAFATFNLGSVLRDVAGAPDIGPAPKPGETRDPALSPPVEVRLGAFQPAGDGYYAPVYRVLDRDGAKFAGSSYGSNYDATALNIVFFNPATNQTKRLLPDDRGQITQQTPLRDREPSGPLRALLLVYVAADTNGDGRLSDTDLKRVILARPDGSGMVTLADGVDALDTTWRREGAASLRYFTRRGDVVSYGEVDLDSFDVKPDRTVPTPKL